MAKFNYKKWVTENKHGKLNEQSYQDPNFPIASTPGYYCTPQNPQIQSTAQYYNFSDPGVEYGGPYYQGNVQGYTTVFQTPGVIGVINTSQASATTNFPVLVYNSPESVTAASSSCYYMEPDPGTGSMDSGTGSIDLGTGSATNTVTCYGCVNGTPTPMEFDTNNFSGFELYQQNNYPGFCGINNNIQYFYSTDHHAFNNCPSTGSVDSGTPTGTNALSADILYTAVDPETCCEIPGNSGTVQITIDGQVPDASYVGTYYITQIANYPIQKSRITSVTPNSLPPILDLPSDPSCNATGCSDTPDPVSPPASVVTPPAFEDPCEKLKKEPKEKVMDFCTKCAQTNNMLDPLCKCCDKLGVKIDPKKLKMDPKAKALKEIIKKELRKIMQEQAVSTHAFHPTDGCISIAGMNIIQLMGMGINMNHMYGSIEACESVHNPDYEPEPQPDPTPGAGSYSIVQSDEFPSELQSQHPGFNALSWAQNFQETKVSPRILQGGNACNFLKNQKNKLVTKTNPISSAAMNAAGENVLTTSTHNQLRQSNKHYDRLSIKIGMMQMIMFKNGCPGN